MKNCGHIEKRCFQKCPHLRPDFSSKGLVSDVHETRQDAESINKPTENETYICLFEHQVLNANSQNLLSSGSVIDSGATAHMTFDRSIFQNIQSFPSFSADMCDKSVVAAERKGTVSLTLATGNNEVKV